MSTSKRPYKILLRKVESKEENKKDTNETKKKEEESKHYEDRHYRKNDIKHYEENEKTIKSKMHYNSRNRYYDKYSMSYSRYDEKLNKQHSSEKKKDVLVPLLEQASINIKKKKIIIRKLPPTLTEENFFDSFSNNIKDELDYYYFVNGSASKDSSNDIIYSRIYLSFKDDMKTDEFIRTQNGKFFYDLNGVKYKALVSYAPNQTLIKKNKPDSRNNTLESDEYFLKCCEEMNNPVQRVKKDIDYSELINVQTENGAILSPIVIELRSKKKK